PAIVSMLAARKGGRMLAIPRDSAREPALQVESRLPAGERAQTRRIDELTVDLAFRRAGAADVGLDRRPDRAADGGDDLANGPGSPPAGIEGLAARALAVERAGELHVGLGGVLDVEEVALRAAV